MTDTTVEGSKPMALVRLLRTGQVTLPADFIRNVAGAAPGLVLDEVLHDIEVRIDGPLATVWTSSSVAVGLRLSVSKKWRITTSCSAACRRSPG